MKTKNGNHVISLMRLILHKSSSHVLCVIITLFVLSLFNQFAIAQHEESESFSKFRVLTITGQRYEGNTGSITDSLLSGKLDNGLPLNIRNEDIRSLDISCGRQTLKGVAIGGGIGLLAFVLVALQIEMEPMAEWNVDPGKVALILTASGAAIGALIGTASTKWCRYPIQPSVNFSSDIYNNSRLSIQLSFNF